MTACFKSLIWGNFENIYGKTNFTKNFFISVHFIKFSTTPKIVFKKYNLVTYVLIFNSLLRWNFQTWKSILDEFNSKFPLSFKAFIVTDNKRINQVLLHAFLFLSLSLSLPLFCPMWNKDTASANDLTVLGVASICNMRTNWEVLPRGTWVMTEWFYITQQ